MTIPNDQLESLKRGVCTQLRVHTDCTPEGIITHLAATGRLLPEGFVAVPEHALELAFEQGRQKALTDLATAAKGEK